MDAKTQERMLAILGAAREYIARERAKSAEPDAGMAETRKSACRYRKKADAVRMRARIAQLRREKLEELRVLGEYYA